MVTALLPVGYRRAAVALVIAGLTATITVIGAPVRAGAAPPVAPIADPAIGPNAAQQSQFGVTAAAPSAATPRMLRPSTSIQPNQTGAAGRPNREVFGFAPYWELANWQEWRFNLLTTVSYFGITLDASGNPVNDAGLTGWNSDNLTGIVQAAHANGNRALVTIKSFNDNDISAICSNPQNAINQTIALVRNRGMDGVTLDFEGGTDSAYPNIQQCVTNFVGNLRNQLHAAVAGSELVVATYSGSASWDGGIFNIGALSPNTDAFFVMAYDMYQSSTTASANAPLNGATYNDTSTVQQYLSKTNASKIILGVPYYGYKWSVSNPGQNVPASSGPSADTYSTMFDDFNCAGQLSYHWDSTAASPWAAWYSPSVSDPCGGNYGSWRELYYENTTSLGAKYDLINNSGIRGMGIWALGYDTGHPELWDLIVTKFGGTTPGATAAVRGSDNQLYVSSSPGAYTAYGGVLTDAPAVTSSYGQRYYVVTGTDNALWVRSDGAGWQRLGPPGTWCQFSPAAEIDGGVLTVVCIGVGGTPYLGQTTVPGSGLPSIGGWTALGGHAVSGPAVTVAGSGLSILVNGTDGRVWTRTLAQGWTPQPWSCTGHLAAAHSGSAAYFACQGAGAQLYVATTTTGEWSTFLIGGVLIDGPGLAAGGSMVRVFVEGDDRQMWETTVSLGGGSSGFTPGGGVLTNGAAGSSF